jgi:hypothetical protein
VLGVIWLGMILEDGYSERRRVLLCGKREIVIFPHSL